MRNTIALVLGGGRGTRLYPLTKFRSKPAAPLGGKYRLIDIPLSNCINSDLHRIYVLTQFMSVSLHRHIRQTYQFDRFSGGFVEILAAQQTIDEQTDWFQGTADAVRKNIRYVQQPGVEHVLILSVDQLYRMDYGDMLRTHQQSGADVTIAAMPVHRRDVSALGVMRVNETGKVDGFLEKPQEEKDIDMVRMDPAWIDAHGVASGGREFLASMGIYLFNRDTLVDALDKTDYTDFGREVFPASIRSRHVQVHLFDDYWEDIGTIRAFYEANLALAQPEPPFPLFRAEKPIYSRARFLPPTLVDGAKVSGSLVADGCRIGQGAVIENSIIGTRCVIGRNVTIRNSVLMGADFYETDKQLADDHSNGEPPLGIGDGAVIEGAIVDKNCRIAPGVRVGNLGGVDQSDLEGEVVIADGIPVVVKGAALHEGWTL